MQLRKQHLKYLNPIETFQQNQSVVTKFLIQFTNTFVFYTKSQTCLLLSTVKISGIFQRIRTVPTWIKCSNHDTRKCLFNIRVCQMVTFVLFVCSKFFFQFSTELVHLRAELGNLFFLRAKREHIGNFSWENIADGASFA